MKVILAFDPSGAFNEGKGTTGWCLLQKESKEIIDIGAIAASDYPTDMQYFAANVDILRFFKNRYQQDLEVVIEDYVLYAKEAQSQTNSHMETCQLIGVLKYQAFLLDMPVHMQMAMQVVNRWGDPVLQAKGIISNGMLQGYPANPHEKDAFRHALHYATFGTKPAEGESYELHGTDPKALKGGTRSRSGLIPRGFCFAEEDGTGRQ